MPTCVHLMKLGTESLETMEHGPDHRQAAREVVAGESGELQALYYAFGRCDVVALAEYPDDDVAVRAAVTFRGEDESASRRCPPSPGQSGTRRSPRGWRSERRLERVPSRSDCCD